MEIPNNIGCLSHLGCVQGQSNRNSLGMGLQLGESDMAPGTSQAVGITSYVHGSTNSCIAGGVKAPLLYPKIGRALKSKRRALGKLPRGM